MDHALIADIGPSAGDGDRVCACGPMAVPSEIGPPGAMEMTHGAAKQAVSVFRKIARAWTVHCALDEDTAEDVVLAVDEAVTNVVEHAYPRAVGVVRLQLVQWECGELLVAVEDEGTWLPPSDPGYRGRGLLLIERLADQSRVTPTEWGTTVQMRWMARP